MEIINLVHLIIEDRSHISEARLLSSAALDKLNVNEKTTSNLLIIISELVSNLTKHTPAGGQFLLQYLKHNSYSEIIIIATDKGKGISNLTESLRDGFSTAGTAGTGFGSVNRLSDSFDIYTKPDSGTSIVVKKTISGTKTHLFDLGVICIPQRGEQVPGDNWGIQISNKSIRLLLSDGLGHGIFAAEASKAIVNNFLNSNETHPIQTVLNDIHLSVKHTRGAAVSITEFLPGQDSLNYCGIGNINSAIIIDNETRTLLSHNGIIGYDIKKIVQLSYPWNSSNFLIMHSDGLSARWNLAKYPGLIYKSSSLIAATLFRDFSRGNDDSTIAVIKFP